VPAQASSDASIRFPPGLNNDDRAVVHAECRKACLRSAAKGARLFCGAHARACRAVRLHQQVPRQGGLPFSHRLQGAQRSRAASARRADARLPSQRSSFRPAHTLEAYELPLCAASVGALSTLFASFPPSEARARPRSALSCQAPRSQPALPAGRAAHSLLSGRLRRMGQRRRPRPTGGTLATRW